MIQTVIFDIDGTLIDSLPINAHALQLVAKEHFGQTITLDDFKHQAAYPGRVIVENFKLLPVDDSYDLWVKKLEELNECPTFFDGIEELLNTLLKAGIQVGLFSSKNRQLFQLELGHHEVITKIEVVVLYDDTTKHKPDPEGLLFAMQQLQAKPQECVYIGDTQQDYECAMRANTNFILAKWGALQSVHCPYVCETPQLLIPLLQTMK